MIEIEYNKVQPKKVNLSKNKSPVNTRRRFNVYETSTRRRRRCIDVLQTLKQRRVSTGLMQIFPVSLI